jgi:hypothetical protein
MKIRESRTWRRIVNALGRSRDDAPARVPNTAGLRSKLGVEQQAALFRLSEHPGYQVLLDVIEMACVEQDTRLINTDASTPEAVLTEHRMSKAFWQIFVAIQKKIEFERGEYLGLQQRAAADSAEEEDESGVMGVMGL